MGVRWRLLLDGTDVSCDTEFSFTAEMGRDDHDDFPQPGRLSFTMHVAGANRAVAARPRATSQLQAWVEGYSGSWMTVWSGRVADVTRSFSFTDSTPRNTVRVDCTGPLADAARAQIPAGAAGNFPAQPDGQRVQTVLAQANLDMGLTRPVAGHIVNDSWPSQQANWGGPGSHTKTWLGAGPAHYTRSARLPNLAAGDHLDIAIEFTCSHPVIVSIEVGGKVRAIRYATAGTHFITTYIYMDANVTAPQMELHFTALSPQAEHFNLTWAQAPVGTYGDVTIPGTSTEVKKPDGTTEIVTTPDRVVTTWDQGAWTTWTPWEQQWLMQAPSNQSTTVTVKTVDVWRSGWDAGAVWIEWREPKEQSSLEHIKEVCEVAQSVLWETRDGQLQYQSDMTRKTPPDPALDLDACWVEAATESKAVISSVVNDVSVAYGIKSAEGEDRPRVELRDDTSIADHGRIERNLDGPLRDKADAEAVAAHIIATKKTPRERASSLTTLSFGQLPTATVAQLLRVPLGSLVAIHNTPTGWIRAGNWRAFLEGWTLTGRNGDVSMELALSDYFDSTGVALPPLDHDTIDGSGAPPGGLPGPQGPPGRNVHVTISEQPPAFPEAGDIWISPTGFTTGQVTP